MTQWGLTAGDARRKENFKKLTITIAGAQTQAKETIPNLQDTNVSFAATVNVLFSLQMLKIKQILKAGIFATLVGINPNCEDPLLKNKVWIMFVDNR